MDEYERQKEFETSKEEAVEVDASKWEYVLLQYEDGMCEIIIQAPGLRELDEVDKQTSAEILLDGVLGEEKECELCRQYYAGNFWATGQDNFHQVYGVLQCYSGHRHIIPGFFRMV